MSQVSVVSVFNLYDCMGGGKITGGKGREYSSINKRIAGGGVYVGNKCTFNMYGGEITGNAATGGGGVQVYEVNANFNMYGGKITGNIATEFGGGVSNAYNFNMYGGEITNNTARYGGGVLNNSGTFNMSGGVISGNTATATADSSSTLIGGGGVDTMATFNMSGGEITNNEAKYAGGGVLVRPGYGNLTISNGKITNNTAMSAGGGIYLGKAKNTHTVGGAPEITGNTVNGAANDLYFGTNAAIASSELSEGVQIGVSMANHDKPFITPAPASGQENRFFSHDDGYGVVRKNDGIYLGQLTYYKATVTVRLNDEASNALGVPQFGDNDMTATGNTGEYTYTSTSATAQDVKINGDTVVASLTPTEAGATATVDYYTLDYANGGGSGTLPDPANYLSGTEATLPNCPLTNGGKVFAGWKIGNDVKQPGETVTISAATTATATWNQQSFEAQTPSGESFSMTLSPTQFIYNGTSQTPTVTVNRGDTPLTVGTDYEVSYSNNNTSGTGDRSAINAGTVTVTVTGKGDYTGTL